MTHIAKNDELLNYLSGDKSLISASISRFDIFYANHKLNIDVYITLLYSKDEKDLKIQFQNVSQYGMFYTSDHYFYYIERYKFFKSDKGYYISFDPFEENREIQVEDNNFILADNMEGYFL
ncbi:hypothetical protein [Mucilaginibacter gotjawali]|uniref:Uncharacterized protein n=2 Tax=Mucilaginibacter gotjawali TaxID=1550579 RepID=A0A110B4B9_9SPHI|nr:hypothetical protein [Mucilaginibacter gotjawali]MBB3055077.1 hypothetical protein [Mucilaginibacter gotjawali]BAU56307.1 hypothetical protein MgSA37_04504 [Mucilaginibacter gotjawali]